MVYVFLAQGFEPIEAITPIDMLRRAQIEVTSVSISDSLSVRAAHGVTVQADALFRDLDFRDAEMLVLPGGQPGTTNLSRFEPLCSLLKEAPKRGIELAAICAAPSVLEGLGLLDGLKATIYPGCALGTGGACFTDAFTERDGSVTTAVGPAAALAFGARLITVLRGEAVSDAVLKAMQYDKRQ